MNNPIPVWKTSRFLICSLALAGALGSASAATYTWVGNTSPNWSLAGNWAPAGVPVANDLLSFTNAGTAGTLLNHDLATGLILNGLTFQTNASAYTLGGNAFGLNGGITNAATTNTQTINNAIILQSAGTVNATGPVVLAGPLSGAFSLTKLGAGTLTLSAPNTHGGATILSGGTLQLSGGNNRLPSTNAFTLGGTSTLDVGNTTQSLASLSVLNLPMTATFQGAGALTVSGTANLELGPGGTVAPTTNIVVNMAGLNSFAYDSSGGTFRVGLKSGAGNGPALAAVATVTLAANNTIRANALAVGDVGANNDGGQQWLYLGQNNALQVGSINVGASGRSDANLEFSPSLVSPSATIRAADGIGPVGSWNIGRVSQTGGGQTTFDAVVNFASGTVDALVTNIVLASADAQTQTGRRGTQNGTFSMGNGALVVSNLTIGRMAGQASGTLGAAFTANGTFNLNAGGTLTATTINLAENTIQSGGGFTRTVNGTLNINGGTVKAQTIQQGAQTAIAGTYVVNPILNFNSGVIANFGPSSDLTIPSGPSIRLAASGTHTFDISAGRTATVGAVIANATTAGTLVKDGPGTLLLTNANTYTGSTTISNGTLALGAGGSLASSRIILTPNGVLDVSAAPAATLGTNQALVGNGGVKGNFAAGPAAQISPAGVGAAGTLAFSNNLALNGSTLVLDLSNNPLSGNDRILVNGSVTLNGNTTIAVTGLGGALAAGPYTLVTYSSINLNGFQFVISAPRGATINVGPTAITLTTSGSGAGNLTWVGDGTSNNWDVQSTPNWLNGVSPDSYFQNDNVTFDNSGSISPAVNLTSTLFPNSVIINSSLDYTFAGPGELAGAMTLTKNGAGSLTLSNLNTFTGATTIGGGSLVVATGGELGAGNYAAPILNNGSLVYTSTAPQTLSGPISGSGSLNKNGGTLTLSGANSLSGGITNAGGDILASTATAFGSSGVTVNSAGAARLLLANGQVYTNTFSLDGGSAGLGNGMIQVATTTSSSTITGPILVNASAASGGHFRGPTTSGVLLLAGPITAAPGVELSTRDGHVRFSGGGDYSNMTFTATTSLGATNGIATNCVLNIGAAAAGTFDLNGFNQRLAGIRTGNSFRAWITNSDLASLATLTLAGDPVVQNYGGSIVGNLAVSIIGGTHIFSNSGVGGNGIYNYSGGTTISNGTLQAGAANVLPSGAGRGDLLLTNNGVLDLNTFSQSINGLWGNGTVDTLAGGSPVLTVGNNASNSTFGGLLQGSIGLAKAGAGTFTLTGANTFNGGTTVANGGGNLRITNPNALGSGTVTIAKGGVASGTLQLDIPGVNSILNPFGGFASTSFQNGDATVPCIQNLSGDNTISSDLTVTTTGGNGLAVQSDGGLLVLSGNIGTSRTDTRGLLLNGVGQGVISGSINGGSSPAFFVQKHGSGTWTLTGNNTYSGNTTINGGTLALGSTALLASPLINVASNALFDVSAVSGYSLNFGQALGGRGAVKGHVTAPTGSQVLPGGLAAFGTLVLSNGLTLGGGQAVVELSANPAGNNDRLHINGELTLSADSQVVVNGTEGYLGAGTYTLITYSSINLSGFSLTLVGSRGTLNVGPTAVTLTVTGSGENLVWVGDGAANNWDIQVTTNWLKGVVLDYFYPSDSVTFNDSGSANPPVNLVSTLVPSSVTVNATQDYTFSGPGQLAGPMSLTKSGTGTLYLNNSNIFTGPVTINAGTIRLDGSALLGGGSYAAPIVNNGQLVHASLLNQTFQGPISGTGTLEVSGGSTVTLSGTNSYTGGTTINGGTLSVTGSGTLGAGAYAATIANFGVLSYASSADQSLSGVISGSGSLAKTVGTNTLTLSGANTYSGSTTLGAGTLRLIGGNDRLPTATTLAFTGSSIVDLGSTHQTLAGMTFPNGSMTAIFLGSGGSLVLNGPSDLQIGPGGNLGSTLTTVLDLSALSSFTFDSAANVVRIGLKSGSQNSNSNLGEVANVRLAATNTIRAASLLVADVGASNDGGANTIQLGNNNSFLADTMTIGYSGRSDVTVSFATNTTAPVLRLRAADGISEVPILNIGRVAQFSSANQVNFNTTMDLSAGTLDAEVRSMNLATGDSTTQTGRRGTQTVNFTMGAGTLSAGNLTLGRLMGQAVSGLGGAMTAAGTFTLNHAAGTLRATNIFFAENTIQATNGFARTASGTLNLLDGTLKARTIELGTQSAINDGTYTITAALNWTAGTIRNLDAGTDLSISNLTTFALLGTGVHTFEIDAGRVGLINQSISGTGALAKNGLGTLVLAATNRYTGNTLVNAGTLQIAEPTLATNSTVSVAAGAVLHLGFNGPNTVAGLVLNGLSQAPGVYNSTNAPGFITGPGSLVIPSSLPTTPTTLMVSVTGNTMTLSWPANYQGWVLQYQTNGLNTGLSNNWQDVPGSQSVNTYNVSIDSVTPVSFYRLRYP